MTKPAKQLLANLGFIAAEYTGGQIPPCYVAVTEAALAAAQRRGMERAAQMLERMAKLEEAHPEILRYAALQIRARKGQEE